MALPDALQVRIAPRFAERVRAGAPEPQRALTAAELADNLRYFAEPGPRGRPIVGLVLSGLPEAEALPDVAQAVAAARAASVRWCTAHVDRQHLSELAASPLLAQLDRVVVAVRSEEPLVRPRAALALHVVVPLEAGLGDRLPAVLGALVAAAPASVVLTWPFPAEGVDVEPASAWVPRIRAALPALAALPWSLKGLPACALTELLPAEELQRRVSRSSNRWYVDAAHQRERALLFLPEVVRFAKREVCRFCALDPRCDGVAEAWLASGRVGPLVPVPSA
ncbi:MAG: hypothetical protein R3F59_10100 [Myxococcota bacterium]